MLTLTSPVSINLFFPSYIHKSFNFSYFFFICSAEPYFRIFFISSTYLYQSQIIDYRSYLHFTLTLMFYTGYFRYCHTFNAWQQFSECHLSLGCEKMSLQLTDQFFMCFDFFAMKHFCILCFHFGIYSNMLTMSYCVTLLTVWLILNI